VVANLYRCRTEARYLTDAALLRQFCLDSITQSGLTALGDLFHSFEGGGVTGAVVLAESHLAIHTWPEMNGVTLDVYVCYYIQDTGKGTPGRRRTDRALRSEDFVPRRAARPATPVRVPERHYGHPLLQAPGGRRDFQRLEVHDTPQFGSCSA
jgi:S-adenosylmethionine decarboxylase proenzyme